MKNYFNKEEIKKIEIVNAGMGMNHRTKPFDFKNAEDLNEAFKLSVCEFLDYKEYWSIMVDLDENFDESVEYYDPTNWINMSIDQSIDDKLLIKAIKSIRNTEDVLEKLYSRAEEKCRKMVEIILKSESDIQDKILGKHYVYDNELVEEIFDDEGIFGIEYHYKMEESYKAFIGYINETLQDE